eukprot:6551178-Lingulodinium_polyedra.AAC.1
MSPGVPARAYRGAGCPASSSGRLGRARALGVGLALGPVRPPCRRSRLGRGAELSGAFGAVLLGPRGL